MTAPAATTLRSRLQAQLPTGALGVGGGLLVLGASAYGYLAAAGNALAPADFSALSVLWVVAFTLGPGIFLPVELELARVVAHERAVGGRWTTRAVRVVGVSLALLALLLLALLAGRGWVARALFDGSGALTAALAGSLVALWLAHVVRGLCSGLGRFRRYAAQLVVDGLVRVLGAVALAMAGVTDPAAYAAVLVAGPRVAVVLTLPPPAVRRAPRRGAPVVRGEVVDGVLPPATRSASANVGLLLASNVTSQAVANAPVVAAQLAPGEDRAAAGALLSGLVIARVALFLYSSVQASLVPGLAADRAAGDRARFVSSAARAARAVALLGAGGALGAVLVGPVLAPLLSRSGGLLGRADLLLLALAAAAFMLASLASQVLVALERHADPLPGWVLGLVVLTAYAAAGPGPLFLRVEVAGLLACVAALVVQSAALALRLRRWAAPVPPPVPPPAG